MSSRKHKHRTQTQAAPPQTHGGVLGALLTVEGKIIADSLPLPPAKRERLLQTILTMTAHYESGGLPPKLFFFRFQKAQFMVLFSRFSMLIVLAHEHARMVDVEIAARKVVATAHLRQSPMPENMVTASLQLKAASEATRELDAAPAEALLPSPPTQPTQHQPTTMTWNEATQALENIMAKVLSQAQAARLITSAIQRKGIDTTRPCDAASFAEVGAELTAKIPSRPIRASLEKEVAELVNKLR